MRPYRVYSNKNVLEAARERMDWIFKEFENVVVMTSGGKDSVVNYHLALEAARRNNRLPLNVMFLDQEIEWKASIEVIRAKMENPDVRPFWMQIPFKLSNSTSQDENWLYCWDPARRHLWMREQESYSIKENVYGKDRFTDLLAEIPRFVFNSSPSNPVVKIGGVRCEESPARTLGLTGQPTWKWVTWGQVSNKRHGVYTLYPLYDWHSNDVWKAIHEHGWQYNQIYDRQFQKGFPIKAMRISNFHHETSVENMFTVQEFEPDTYERAVARLAGLDSAAKLGYADFYPKELPPMFTDWKEYRDFLLPRLIKREDWRAIMAKRFAKQDAKYAGEFGDKLYRVHVTSILTNDWEGVKGVNFDAQSTNRKIGRAKKNERTASLIGQS